MNQHVYNGILFICKKDWSSDACYNVNEPWKHAKWNKSGTEGLHFLWSHLYDMPGIVKFLATEDRMVVTRDWDGPGNGELSLTECRVSVWNDKTFLELVIGDSWKCCKYI